MSVKELAEPARERLPDRALARGHARHLDLALCGGSGAHCLQGLFAHRARLSGTQAGVWLGAVQKAQRAGSSSPATLCIAAYGFLLHQRLTPGNKKTPLDPQRLAYPKVLSLAAAGRAQRPMPDAIASLRQLIAVRQSQANSCDVHAVE